jgi:hypothetical protein
VPLMLPKSVPALGSAPLLVSLGRFVCLRVCVRERERESARACARARERDRRECVCVRERQRERERHRRECVLRAERLQLVTIGRFVCMYRERAIPPNRTQGSSDTS